MRKRRLIFLVLGTLLHAISSPAAEPSGENEKIMTRHSLRSAFQLALNNHFEEKSQKPPDNQNEIQISSRKKSVAKAVLLSAALPGAGEFYTGSYIKAAAFVVVEAAAIAGYVHFNNRGDRLEAEFEQFASANWEPAVYWDWLAEISDNPRDSFETDEAWMQALRDYERANFSHTLPQEQNQQYFENISKYNQFNVGWIDTETGNGRDSDLRSHYTLMRKDANDAFKRATNFATLTLFNHLISAFDAGFTAKRRNKVVVETNIGMQGKYYNDRVVPSLTLDVKW